MAYLRYVGKKLPFKFENPHIKAALEFATHDEVIEVSSADATWIFKHNPTGFVQLVDPARQHSAPQPKNAPQPENAPEPEPEVVNQDMYCPHCHKRYTDENWYKRHVSKCSEKGQ